MGNHGPSYGSNKEWAKVIKNLKLTPQEGARVYKKIRQALRDQGIPIRVAKYDRLKVMALAVLEPKEATETT